VKTIEQLWTVRNNTGHTIGYFEERKTALEYMSQIKGLCFLYAPEKTCRLRTFLVTLSVEVEALDEGGAEATVYDLFHGAALEPMFDNIFEVDNG
jgi:hypothetical protein